MAVILVASTGEDLMLNWWNWRPIVALLVRSGVLSAGEREERCSFNACGGLLSAEETIRAAETAESIATSLNPGGRLLLDGTSTNKPKNLALPISEWDEDETWNHYSVNQDVLRMFAEFCRRSGGFEVV